MQKTTRQWQIQIWKVLIVTWWPFQFSMKFEKSLLCLHLKQICPAIFSKTLVLQS